MPTGDPWNFGNLELDLEETPDMYTQPDPTPAAKPTTANLYACYICGYQYVTDDLIFTISRNRYGLTVHRYCYTQHIKDHPHLG